MAADLDDLIAASIGGDAARASALLDRDSDLISAMTMLGATAIHAAHYSGQAEIVSLLVARGRAFDLMLMAELGLVDELKAALDGNAALVTEVSPAGSTLLHGACYWGGVPAAKLLLDHGADVNGRRRDGMTALHTAGYRGHLKVIRRLVEHGADPMIRAYENSGSHSGESPADTAMAQGQTEAAELLEKLAMSG
jgi:ankyrin repeat protein